MNKWFKELITKDKENKDKEDDHEVKHCLVLVEHYMGNIWTPEQLKKWGFFEKKLYHFKWTRLRDEWVKNNKLIGHKHDKYHYVELFLEGPGVSFIIQQDMCYKVPE